MSKLAELGRAVAHEQDLVRAQHGRDERAAARFVRNLKRPTRGIGARPWLAAAAVVAAAAMIVLAFGRKPAARDAATPVVGQPLVAGGGRSVPLNFPDGSQVVLASGTEAVVREIVHTGAKLEVSRGEAAIAVHHQPTTSWLVDAGPYQVHVVGTRFTVGWQPEQERFALRLEQGSVVVSAGSGTHSAVTMVAPASLVIDHGNWQLNRPQEAAANDEPPASTPSASDPPGAPAVDSAAPVVAQLPAGPSWEELARAGKYAAAHGEATRRGIAQLADTRPSATLLSLAEVCRFSAHAQEGSQVLSRVRARFPGTDDAAIAAFQLGRSADGTDAANWFRTYLKERPNGSLAMEASGRLLEALSRAGDRTGAQSAAEAYLARYPTGPHSAFARQLLGR